MLNLIYDALSYFSTVALNYIFTLGTSGIALSQSNTGKKFHNQCRKQLAKQVVLPLELPERTQIKRLLKKVFWSICAYNCERSKLPSDFNSALVYIFNHTYDIMWLSIMSLHSTQTKQIMRYCNIQLHTAYLELAFTCPML